MLVSTFVREVFLYPDKVVITFNFTDRPPERVKPTREYARKIESEIKAAEKAPFSRDKSSQSVSAFAPNSRPVPRGRGANFMSCL